MSERNLARVLRISFNVAVAVTGIAMIASQPPEHYPSIEANPSELASVYLPKETFYSYMRSQGWEYLLNEDSSQDITIANGQLSHKRRDHPKTKAEIAAELGLPENVIRVEPFAYDSKDKPIKNWVSVWITNPGRMRPLLSTHYTAV